MWYYVIVKKFHIGIAIGMKIWSLLYGREQTCHYELAFVMWVRPKPNLTRYQSHSQTRTNLLFVDVGPPLRSVHAPVEVWACRGVLSSLSSVEGWKFGLLFGVWVNVVRYNRIYYETICNTHPKSTCNCWLSHI